jgi:hypothetical protein
MFKRLIFDDWVTIFPLVAFITAACIFVSFVWRAVRMRRNQIERFANLPFNAETPTRHEHAAKS